MNKKMYLYLSIFLVVLMGGILLMKSFSPKVNSMKATVLSVSNTSLTVKTKDDIYTLDIKNPSVSAGENIVIKYTGLLDKNNKIQDISIISYEVVPTSVDGASDSNSIIGWDGTGIFKQYYNMAKNRVNNMSLDEKIGQLLLVRYPDNDAIELIKKYHFAGYVFYEKDFKNKTKNEVIDMIDKVQNTSKIPLLTAVDEEGGTVVRVSSNPNLATSKFLSPHELYQAGGFDLIREDTIEKSRLLKSLGLNLNLAPVVDVSTNPDDYMYPRTLGKDTLLTSTYAETVIEASKNSGVSYTLKHFPGYGNNSDTHISRAVDSRSYDDIRDNDLPPFKAGIDKGAESVLVSHNIVNAIDNSNPASLSLGVHQLLRNDLGFSGVIISDDLAMGALDGISNPVIKAIQAGNDLLIVTDYEESINEIKEALEDGTLEEDTINQIATKIIAWKYYKGLMVENQK